MSGPRDIIAEAEVEFLYNVPVKVTAKGADAILAALSQAGYRIVKDGPVAWLVSGPGWGRVFVTNEAAEKLARGEWGATIQPLFAPPPKDEADGE